MPENQSQSQPRIAGRNYRSDISWILVVFAVVLGGLAGYVLRPAVENAGRQTNAGISTDTGLTESARAQVNESITEATAPLATSLEEILQRMRNEDQAAESANGIERVSSELDTIRLMLNDREDHIKNLIAAGDEEARANLDAFVTQTNQQLYQMNDLENSVNQLAAEIPRLRNTVQTLRPVKPETGEQPDTVFDPPSLDDGPDSTSQPVPSGMGLLIINSTSARDAAISINGQNQTLSPGRNTFMVPVQQIELRHPESSTVWNLDASMWEQQGDQYVISRKWVF